MAARKRAVGSKKGKAAADAGPALPSFAIAHVVLRVADVRSSAAFYDLLGLRPVWREDGIAILELRGGTHLLLFPSKKREKGERTAPFDLMADDLAAAHASVMAVGLSPSAVGFEPRGGHDFFTVADPDGNRITIYSSHTEGRPV